MLEVSYNYYLVGLSYAIAVFGSYTALQLAIRIPTAKGSALWGWLGCAALALGGGAIWSMHFIGMLAYNMSMKVNYDITLTIGSLILAIVVAGIGLFIVGRGQAHWIKLIFAGIAGGLGVSGMHYTGMAAMIMPADISYNFSIVVISIVIAIVAATVALWMAFNLRGNLQRFFSAFIMGIAVCGMHYTAMSGVSITANDNVVLRTSYFYPVTMALIIFGITAAFLIILLLVTIFQSTKNITQKEIEFG